MTDASDTFWGYEDLGLFLGAVLPSLAFASILARSARFPSEGIQAIAFQSMFDAFLMGALYLLISFRHRRPFWRSLAWIFSYRGAWLCIVGGPILAIGLAALGAALRTPDVSAIQDLVTTRLSLVVVVLFGTLLAPMFEELLFRGFLFPLFARSLGAWAGILLTAAPFALLHGSQYHWSWQSMLIIGLAGVVFGYARYKTGSTAAAATLHVGYNVTLFAMFLVQQALTTL